MAQALPSDVAIGVFGGTGVYNIEGMNTECDLEVDTPFGKPSSPVHIGIVNGVKVAFIARHGAPLEYVKLWMLGVRYVLSFSACGSLKEEFAYPPSSTNKGLNHLACPTRVGVYPSPRPGDMVLCDQFIDRAFHRNASFFGDGCVGHVEFGDPTDATLGNVVRQAAEAVLPN
eukprot:gene3732-4142_t